MSSMKRRDFLTKATAGAVGAGAVAACGTDGPSTAAAQSEGGVISGPRVQWRVVSSFPPSLDILHGGADRVAQRVSDLTEGQFTMRVFAAGELVPGLQVMDAVEAGTAQAGLTAGYYYIGKNPALAFDATVPFGLNARQQIAWLLHGGGLELLRGVYGEFGIINFPVGNTGAQMGGWFRRPINSRADLNGLRMRIPGIGGEIMTRLGASVQVLAGGDIYPALERGAIDATEWVGPYDDEKLGFYQVAPYYYMPGWWEPGASMSLQVSRAAYDELPATYQTILEEVCREVMQDMLARYDAENPLALQRLVNQHGVRLSRFPDDMLEAAWRESNAYLEEQAAASADFRQVYDSFKSFRDAAFPYFAGNELAYAQFAFNKIEGASTA